MNACQCYTMHHEMSTCPTHPMNSQTQPPSIYSLPVTRSVSSNWIVSGCENCLEQFILRNSGTSLLCSHYSDQDQWELSRTISMPRGRMAEKGLSTSILTWRKLYGQSLRILTV